MKIKEWQWRTYRAPQSRETVVRRKKEQRVFLGLSTHSVISPPSGHNHKPSKPAVVSCGDALELSYSPCEMQEEFALHLTIRRNRQASVLHFLKQGVNVSKMDDKGNTALHVAMDSRDSADSVVRLAIALDLLEHGADLRCVHLEGYTPFCLAVMDPNSLRFLANHFICNGVNVPMRNSGGKLQWSC